MDFMKVLNETVRDIKREVNLKVLKIPEIEQKVLDATSDEPWGPHGSVLSEIAQATKKFTECQMIMSVLWSRLTETGSNWRHVYKALSVIEYLVANGSERAVDDILEHSFQISSISGFEYVEPNGKDCGINVRKKVETISALLNDPEKVQAARNKAAANRDKYFGLSSTGITYKSSATSFGSSNTQRSDRYGGFGSSKEGDSFNDSYRGSEQFGKETKQIHVDKYSKPKESPANKNAAGKAKNSSSSSSKTPSKPPSSLPDINEDDFDDFDPRGSSTTGSANTNSNQVDLFGESLVDLMDAPTSTPTDKATSNSALTPEVDLFADATFISASPNAEAATGSHTQGNVDFFAGQPAFPAQVPANVDLFAASDSGLPSQTKPCNSGSTNTTTFDPFAASDSGFPSQTKLSSSESMNASTFDPFGASDSGLSSETNPSNPEPTKPKSVDPFAAISLNNFEGSDLFGAFTSNTESATTEPSENVTNNNQTLKSSKPAPKKEGFQVKSGIWSDSLSRGLIDLNITAPKKTNLADIGIVGGLGAVSDEKEKGPPTSLYMGRAMGAGTGLGRSGFPTSTATSGGNGSFSTLGQQQYGSFK